MRAKVKELINELKKTMHGFKHIIAAGEELLSNTSLNHLKIAEELLNQESYQARMLATFLLGEISAGNNRALELLVTKVIEDENWRVQEMLARAIDTYSKTIGYKKALPAIRHWLGNNNQNLKRAVIEGLRIWTNRPYFKDNPEMAISLISKNKSDDSEYLRRSVGNSLRDIRKKYPDLIQKEVATWDLTNTKILFTQKLAIN